MQILWIFLSVISLTFVLVLATMAVIKGGAWWKHLLYLMLVGAGLVGFVYARNLTGFGTAGTLVMLVIAMALYASTMFFFIRKKS